MEMVSVLKSKKGEGYNLLSITIEDKEVLEKLVEWAKNSDECKGFYNLWNRFKNWENKNAFVYVLVYGEDIAGMNAFTCNRVNPYVNCYYFEIDEIHRNRGLGNQLFFSCIEKGKERERTRLTLRTKYNSLGMKFYNHIGMKQRFYDPKTKENIFDLNIEYLDSIKDIKLIGEELNDEPSRSRMKIYSNYEKL